MNVLNCLLGGTAIQNVINKLALWHWAEKRKEWGGGEKENWKAAISAKFPLTSAKKFAGAKNLPAQKIKLLFQHYRGEATEETCQSGVSDSIMYGKQMLTTPQSSSKVQSAMEPHVFCSVRSLPSTVSVRGPVARRRPNNRGKIIFITSFMVL